MKAFWLTSALFIAIIFGIATNSNASGVTSQRNQPGQVYVRDENGTLYLTTETVPGDQTTTVVATAGGTVTPAQDGSLNLVNEPVVPPEGFARDIGVLINAVLSFVMVVAALLVFFYLIWGGIQWITSGGDKGKTDQARQKIISAVIGIIIVAASFAVVNLVVRFLGFTSLNDVLDNVRPINPAPATPVPGDGTPAPTPVVTPTPTPVP